MLHGSWDMETYARTHQEDSLREAAKARQLNAAGLGWQPWTTTIVQRIRQVLASTQARLTELRAAPAAPSVVATEPAVHLTPVAETLAARPAPRSKPAAAAEPYAAMVVIARAAAVPISERP